MMYRGKNNDETATSISVH